MLSNSSYHKKQQDYKKKPLVSTYRPSSNPSTPPSPYLHEDNTLLLKKPTESTGGVISELTQIRSIPYLTLWIVLIIIIVITGVTLFIVYYYPTGANKVTLGSSSSSSTGSFNSSTGS
jgi:hypothetical protein